MAQSINGMIARRNGSEDFLSDANWQTFSSLAKQHQCVIVGRKTYEAVSKWQEYNFDSIKAHKIVVSKKKKISKRAGYTSVTSPQAALTQAKRLGYHNIILAGGAKLNFSFLKARKVNQIILNINPYLLGAGIPLCLSKPLELRLKLLRTKKITSQIIQLQYQVI